MKKKGKRVKEMRQEGKVKVEYKTKNAKNKIKYTIVNR